MKKDAINKAVANLYSEKKVDTQRSQVVRVTTAHEILSLFMQARLSLQSLMEYGGPGDPTDELIKKALRSLTLQGHFHQSKSEEHKTRSETLADEFVSDISRFLIPDLARTLSEIKGDLKVVEENQYEMDSRMSQLEVVKSKQENADSRVAVDVSDFLSEVRAGLLESFSLQDTSDWPGESPLTIMGYHVGYSGLEEDDRRQILQKVFSSNLTSLDLEAETLARWGTPNSAKRKSAILTQLRVNVLKARPKKADMSLAIEEWEADFAYVQRYFKPRP